MLDPFFVVAEFVYARCLVVAVSAATSVAAFATSTVAVVEGLGGEGSD